MPRNWSKAVLEGNVLITHQDDFGTREPAMADFYRMTKELCDKPGRKLDELTEKMKATKQCLTGLESKQFGSHVLP